MDFTPVVMRNNIFRKSTAYQGTHVTDADEEARHFHETMSKKTNRHILANVRRLLPRNRQPNWALAMEVFSVGSTYGRWICKEAGIDPDAKTLTAFDVPSQQ